MVLDPNMPIDPYASLAPGADYESMFQEWAGAPGQTQSIVLPGELSKGTAGPGMPLPPPPPPPPPQQLDQGLPSYEETAAPPMSEPVGSVASPTAEPVPPAPPSGDAMPAAPQLRLVPPISDQTVDAVSGGLTGPQAERILGRTDARGLPNQIDSELPEDYLSQDELNAKVDKESPEQQAKRAYALAQKQQDYILARQADEARKMREQAEADHNAFLQSREVARAEAAPVPSGAAGACCASRISIP